MAARLPPLSEERIILIRKYNKDIQKILRAQKDLENNYF
jgi:hypothetical protein